MRRIVCVLLCLAAATTSGQAADSTASLQAVQAACVQLLAAPENTASLQSLLSAAKGVQDGDLKAAIYAAHAMGLFYGDHAQEGSQTVQYLQQVYPASQHLAALRNAQYYADCPKCSGSGTASAPCSRCGGKSVCPGCSGQKTLVTMGKRVETCPFCAGSGKCPLCKGAGKAAARCSQCFGRGKVVSKELMKKVYVDFILRTKTLAGSQDPATGSAGKDVREASTTKVEPAQERAGARDGGMVGATSKESKQDVSTAPASPGGAGAGKSMTDWRVAAELGDPAAQHVLGLLYTDGQAVHQDHTEAVKWYRKAADRGYAVAQTDLGLCYARGQGVVKDEREAVRWIQKAAEQGNARAQFGMGACCANGQGVIKDDAEAVQWTRKAADQGYAPAQYNLGAFYVNGQGVATDLKAAYGWLLLAISGGDKEATEALQTVEPKLSQAQLLEARNWAKAWKPAASQSSKIPSQ